MGRTRKLATVTGRGDSTASLQLLRQRLAEQLDAHLAGHADGCACSCGQPAGDHRAITALARSLTAVLEALDKRVPARPVAGAAGPAPEDRPQPTAVDEVRRKRDARRAG
jgi:hypothetical protein